MPSDTKALQFVYVSSSTETFFTDRRDPEPTARKIFAFHKPETLLAWSESPKSVRRGLKELPPLIERGLRDCQIEAINRLDESFKQAKLRALIQMATGSGKTFTAVSFVYRLIKFAGAKRILFMVDRKSLGRQAYKEFQQYITPDDGRKFTDLYVTQHQSSNNLNKDCKVCITTIQRLFSMLTGQEIDEDLEEKSGYELGDSAPVKYVQYNPALPIESFDFIITDECHRSIYKQWKQVLDYFDCFMIGLTATPSDQTIGFFNKNLVMDYSHERAISDGVNVGFNVYRIKTQITDHGAKLNSGDWVSKMDRDTRQLKYEQMEDDLEYSGTELDRSVVNKDQIRTVIRAFRDKLFTEIYPDRTEVPKTLIFAKSDAHAEDIVRIIREEFGKGNEFCRKITYKSEENPETITGLFRNSYNPRIAVTVDLISTGTDIKPLEILIFMRDIRSRNYFEQMLGRGTRTLSESDMKTVTPDIMGDKEHFIVIDAVGVCESKKIEMKAKDRDTVTIGLEQQLNQIALGNTSTGMVSMLTNRITKLIKKLDPAEVDKLNEKAGKPIQAVIEDMKQSILPKNYEEKAKSYFKTDEPTDEQIAKVATELKKSALKPFFNPEFRDAINEAKKKSDLIIDEINLDEVIQVGFDEKAEEKAKEQIGKFKEFLETRKDELDALQILYNQDYRNRHLTYQGIKELVEAIKLPPYQLTSDKLWKAYEMVEKDKVKGLSSSTRSLTNIVNLVRHALGQDEILEPFVVTVEDRYRKWLADQDATGKKFTETQKKWLDMIKDHVASSVSIEISDLENTPFKEKGGAMGAYQAFGDDLQRIIEKLQSVLAA